MWRLLDVRTRPNYNPPYTDSDSLCYFILRTQFLGNYKHIGNWWLLVKAGCDSSGNSCTYKNEWVMGNRSWCRNELCGYFTGFLVVSFLLLTMPWSCPHE